MSESRFIAALVPPAMRAELERSARANERTLSGEIRLALREHLEDPGASAPPHRPAVDATGSDDLVGDRRSPSATPEPA
jgi:TraY domain